MGMRLWGMAFIRSKGVIFVIFCCTAAFVVYKVAVTMHDIYTLCSLEDQWRGFGQEKADADYSFTVVTGLFDIGRGSWWKQSRTYNDYLGYLLQILKMDVNIVVFIEPKGQKFVERIRQRREVRTRVIPTQISDLEYFPLLDRIEEIMNSNAFKEGNINYQKGKVEATSPLYNLVTNSKISLVFKAIELNPFNTDYFIWLDGGYGHGDSSIYPPDGIWSPKHLLKHPDKVTFVSFEDLPSQAKDLNRLHKLDTAWMAGGLFAGGTKAMETFYKLHKRVMQGYMDRGTIDDDQTTFSDCFFLNPNNFRPVRGSWYELMKPFR